MSEEDKRKKERIREKADEKSIQQDVEENKSKQWPEKCWSRFS